MSIVFWDKISCHWVKGIFTNEREKERHPLNKRYSTVIGSSNIKMVANRHRHAANITSTGDELLRIVNIDDLSVCTLFKSAEFNRRRFCFIDSNLKQNAYSYRLSPCFTALADILVIIRTTT